MTPLIVEGVPRSGTRFFCKFIEKQFNIKIFRIQNEIISYYKIVKSASNAKHNEVKSLLEHLINEYNFKNRVGSICLDDLKIEYDKSDFGAVLGNILDRQSKKSGFSGWGLKFDNPTGMEACRFFFPECKIVHILRDGRDVNLSACQCINEGYHSPLLNAAFWKSEILNRRRIASGFDGETYFEIKYENILSDPLNSFQVLSNFLNCHDAAFKQMDIKKTNFNKWKERMSKSDIMAYEGIAGDMMMNLDYPLSGLSHKKVSNLKFTIHKWIEPLIIFKMYIVQFLSKDTRHRVIHKINLKVSRLRRKFDF